MPQPMHPFREELDSIGSSNGQVIIAWSIWEVAQAIRYAASRLGTSNASTEMGALELLAKEVRDGLSLLAHAIGFAGIDISSAIEAAVPPAAENTGGQE